MNNTDDFDIVVKPPFKSKKLRLKAKRYQTIKLSIMKDKVEITYDDESIIITLYKRDKKIRFELFDQDDKNFACYSIYEKGELTLRNSGDSREVINQIDTEGECCESGCDWKHAHTNWWKCSVCKDIQAR